ncbi:MAG: 5-(carboxyamino)imidazole ribonucleotide synthase [Leptolyngbyaceae cyanobacterium RU_5_1]|nr:5-(carboxyamino)imidazole ribonucleotide synthase [Leptolyngbyaceae cyanobacterium RU_5_1]
MPNIQGFNPFTTIASDASSLIKRVGVIGGGQLAWMMAGAAQKLGVELVIQTPNETDPAAAIASDIVLAAVDDATATAQLATQCDLITFENEFVDLAALSLLENQGVCFRPGLATLKPLLDKYDQRCYTAALGLPTPRFCSLTPESTREEVGQFLLKTPSAAGFTDPNFPVALKTRRHGYDGQGTFIIKDWTTLQSTWANLGHQPVLLEEFIPFERELAVIAARAVDGTITVYPIVETQQENQVCRRVIAPAQLSQSVMEQVEAIAHTLLTGLQAIGLFGIELFLTPNGTVLVNEIAPRTHNSGHFTLDACPTSQFEQHLRAVCGLPLGSPAMQSAGAVMVNLLGYEHSHSTYQAKRQQLAARPDAHVHWYGKTESRPGRKLGHVTALLNDGVGVSLHQRAIARAQEIESIWYTRS